MLSRQSTVGGKPAGAMLKLQGETWCRWAAAPGSAPLVLAWKPVSVLFQAAVFCLHFFRTPDSGNPRVRIEGHGISSDLFLTAHFPPFENLTFRGGEARVTNLRGGSERELPRTNQSIISG